MAKQKQQLKQKQQINKELVKRMALYADAMLRSGVTGQDVHSKLVEQGLDPASAATVIRTVRQQQLDKLRQRSQRDLRIGIVVLVVGLLVSVLLMTGVIVESSGYGLLAAWAVTIIAGVLVGRAIVDRRTVSQRKAE